MKMEFLTQLIKGRVSQNGVRQRGENPMGFEVQTNSKQIGILLENGNKHDIPTHYKRGKRM